MPDKLINILTHKTVYIFMFLLPVTIFHLAFPTQFSEMLILLLKFLPKWLLTYFSNIALKPNDYIELYTGILFLLFICIVWKFIYRLYDSYQARRLFDRTGYYLKHSHKKPVLHKIHDYLLEISLILTMIMLNLIYSGIINYIDMQIYFLNNKLFASLSGIALLNILMDLILITISCFGIIDRSELDKESDLK